jgi:eukaryotic-like serine/threonine-protein kinase
LGSVYAYKSQLDAWRTNGHEQQESCPTFPSAINEIREVPGDSSNNPHFVETSPRRGYRFIGLGSSAVESPNEIRLSRKTNWKVVVLALILLLAAVVGRRFYSRTRRAAALTEKDSILLADFDNKTGDPIFDDTLKQALAVGLEQSPYLNAVSDWKVGETLHLMSTKPGQRITSQLARDLCQRVSAKAIVEGSIASLGSEYVLILRATNCATGDSLGAEQIQVTSKEQVLSGLDKAASGLRLKLGESLSSTTRYSTTIEQATTPSLEALQAYSAGLKAQDAEGTEAAIPYYHRAIELDPNFAVAYAQLGQTYNDLGRDEEAEENVGKAFQLRGRVSERERLDIDSRYYLIQGDIEQAIQVSEEWRRLYPEDMKPARMLSLYYSIVGRFENALHEAEEQVRMDPSSKRFEGRLAYALIHANRIDQAQAIVQGLKLGDLFGGDLRYKLAFLRGDTEEMQRVLTNVGALPDAFLIQLHAYTEAYHGRLQSAHEFDRRATKVTTTWSDRQSADGWVISFELEDALFDVEFGYPNRGRVAAATLLSPLNRNKVMGVLALALAGDKLHAQAFAKRLLKQYPQDTLLKNYWIPTIRAAVLLAEHDPAEAIHELDVTASSEIGCALYWDIAPLFPVYVRGQAFLAMNKGPEAAAEFQKYLDNPGVVQNYPLAAIAHLGLARAYALEGETVKAHAKYQDFFAIWKDADPDIPILKQAKAEYAKLQ